uniref:Uncharacterized protein n=2 Tax=Aegilops tauschii subsp. strangulata TaxID=200361 RepID=A0A453HZB8_AEGTS
MAVEYASLFFSIRPHHMLKIMAVVWLFLGCSVSIMLCQRTRLPWKRLDTSNAWLRLKVRDYNYSNMKRLDEENQSLKHELGVAKYNKQKTKPKTRSIKNKLMMARYKNKKNAMGWFVLTRYMHGLSDHICNVIALNRSSGKEPMDPLMNEPLNNIEKLAERLKRGVLKSEKQLKSIKRGF